jgi:AcrR family transcriptional regulator
MSARQPSEASQHGTRQRIAEVAFSLFAKRGYSGTSVRMIATEAGLSPGVVTYHFPKKPDLYRGAIGPPYDRFVSALRRSCQGAEVRPDERLADLIDFLSDPGDEALDLGRMLLRQVLDEPEPLKEMVEIFRGGHIAVLTNIVLEAATAGALPKGIGLGVLPIIFGGALLPRLLARSVADEPLGRLIAEILAGQSKENLLILLGMRGNDGAETPGERARGGATTRRGSR